MHVAVTAIGADRPGIVAAVTSVLVAHDANIEDSSMTILRGRFAMVLVVSVPEDTDPDALERELGAATTAMGLRVHVAALENAVSEQHDGERWALSVYGADHPGIVHGVTQLLADRSVNVTDLTTRVIGEERPIYVMLLEVTLPRGADPAALRAELAGVASELGIECNLHRAEPDVL